MVDRFADVDRPAWDGARLVPPYRCGYRKLGCAVLFLSSSPEAAWWAPATRLQVPCSAKAPPCCGQWWRTSPVWKAALYRPPGTRGWRTRPRTASLVAYLRPRQRLPSIEKWPPSPTAC